MIKLNAIEFVYPGTLELSALAERLRKEFASYRIPGSVAKKTKYKSLSEVDEPWLIVLCTPGTPGCEEVKERIAAFSGEGRYHHILTLLVSGKPEESFPRELVFETLPDGTVIEHEPLAANIVAESEKESMKLLSVEKLRLLAPILGVSFDELRNRRRRNQVRLAIALSAVVLTGASIFFAYAFSRMRVMAGQNEALQAQYAQAEEARDRAREQRDAAREEFAGTTAIRAREVLDKGDSELAMLLTLEFLPEAGLTTDLPDILSDALEGLCAEGYVPVTTVREYGKTRYDAREEEEESEEEPSVFPKTISMPVPEEYDNGNETFGLKLEVASEEYGYAVYRGDFDFSKSSADDVYRSRVCFPDDPEKDYYMPYRMEPYKWLTADVILPDGSFIGRNYSTMSYAPYRYNPFTREFLPFYDEIEEDAGAAENTDAENTEGEGVLPGDPDACREAGMYVGEAPGKPLEDSLNPYALEIDVKLFEELEGVDGLIFGHTRTSTQEYGLENDDVKTYVFSREPFRYLYTMDDVILLFRPGNGKYFLGTTGKKLLVFSAEPFQYLYTLEDEFTGVLAQYNFDLPVFPDGRSWLYIHKYDTGKAVYDLDTGKRLSAITVQGQGYDMEISSEGMILSSVRNKPTIWRPEDGTLFRDIPIAEDEDPELFGPYDEVTGRRSVRVIRANSYIYQYRESAIPVPEDLEGQIALAKQLLNGRKLTKKERKTYNLELQ